jgi:hypothetical protein
MVSVQDDDNPSPMTGPVAKPRRQLSLLEVAIVLIVIAALSLFAIPQVQSRRMIAHELGARALLLEIYRAEREFIQANDGKTYGFLDELQGADWRAGVRTRPRTLAASGLRPDGVAWVRDGYLFLVALPGRGVAGVTKESYANANFEKLDEGFLAYAWPVMAGYSARMLYVIDQTGELREYKNDREPPFSGAQNPPPLNLGSRKGDAFGGPPPIARDLKLDVVTR